MQIHSPGQKVITFVSVRSGATQPEAASSPPAPRVEVTPSESDRTNVAPARGSPHNNNHHTAASLVEATQRRNDFLQNDLSKSDHNGGSGEAGQRGGSCQPLPEPPVIRLYPGAVFTVALSVALASARP